jgi:hypothetical protein
MRLADTRLSFEQEPLRDDRKRLSDTPRPLDRFFERLVVGGEVRQGAVLIALRNLRVGEAVVPDLLAPALTADDAPDALIVDGLPSRVVAESTRHV